MVKKAPRIPASMESEGTENFYAAVGRLVIAWGRLEGDFTDLAFQILSFATASKLRRQIKEAPTNWPDRKKFWKKVFRELPELSPMQGPALAFIERLMAKTYSRRLLAESLWGNFVMSEEPGIISRKAPTTKNQLAPLLETRTVPISAILSDAEAIEKLDAELAGFAELICKGRAQGRGG